MFTVTIKDKKIALEEKTQILKLIDNADRSILAAKVNNRLRELTYELSFDCDVELLTLKDSDVLKVYEASLRYLMVMAFKNIYPDYQVKISYAISRSFMVTVVSPQVVMDNKMLNAVVREMDRLVTQDIPFERYSMTKEEAFAYFTEHGETDKAQTLP